MNKKTLGQTEFEAYRAEKNGVTSGGKAIPKWIELTEEERAAWEVEGAKFATSHLGVDPRAVHTTDDRESKPL